MADMSEKSNIDGSQAKKGPGGCTSCKMISVGCLIAIGGYLFLQGRKQNPPANYILYGISAASAVLGVGEIFDKSPFRKNSADA